MFELLFSSTFWYILLGVVALVVIIWACIKFPQGKIFVGTFLAIAIVGFTMYAGIQLNFYYSASGGIYGYITNFFKTNQVEITDATFKFSNMELKQVDEGDIYSARILTDDVVNFESGKTYALFINNMPAQTVSFSKDYISAKYNYNFYDTNRKLILNDSLYLNFAFHTNSTTIEIYTKGGSEAIKYWNYWFNKNTFIVSIEDNCYEDSDDFAYSNLVLKENQVLANYFVNDKLVDSLIVDKDTPFRNVEVAFEDSTKIIGWNDGTYEITENSDYKYYASKNFRATLGKEITLKSYNMKNNGIAFVPDYENAVEVDTGTFKNDTKIVDLIGNKFYEGLMENWKENIFQNDFSNLVTTNGESLTLNSIVSEIDGILYVPNNYEFSFVPDKNGYDNVNLNVAYVNNLSMLNSKLTLTTSKYTISKTFGISDFEFFKNSSLNLNCVSNSTWHVESSTNGYMIPGQTTELEFDLAFAFNNKMGYAIVFYLPQMTETYDYIFEINSMVDLTINGNSFYLN